MSSNPANAVNRLVHTPQGLSAVVSVRTTPNSTSSSGSPARKIPLPISSPSRCVKPLGSRTVNVNVEKSGSVESKTPIKGGKPGIVRSATMPRFVSFMAGTAASRQRAVNSRRPSQPPELAFPSERRGTEEEKSKSFWNRTRAKTPGGTTNLKRGIQLGTPGGVSQIKRITGAAGMVSTKKSEAFNQPSEVSQGTPTITGGRKKDVSSAVIPAAGCTQSNKPSEQCNSLPPPRLKSPPAIIPSLPLHRLSNVAAFPSQAEAPAATKPFSSTDTRSLSHLPRPTPIRIPQRTGVTSSPDEQANPLLPYLVPSSPASKAMDRAPLSHAASSTTTMPLSPLMPSESELTSPGSLLNTPDTSWRNSESSSQHKSKTPRREVTFASENDNKTGIGPLPCSRRVSLEERMQLQIPNSIKAQFSEQILMMMVSELYRQELDEPDLSEIDPEEQKAAAMENQELEFDFDSIGGETISSETLNRLFPVKSDPNEKRLVALFDGTEIPIDLVQGTPDQIRKIRLSQEEEAGVIRLSFFHAALTDDQLFALVERFPNLEHVAISINPKLSDRGIGALAKLKKLKTLYVRGCPLVTTIGLHAFTLVEMAHLEEFGISTKIELGECDLFKELAKAPRLQMVDVSLSENFTDAGLLCFKSAVNGITFNIKGCDRIQGKTIDEMNSNRDEEIQFTFIMGQAERADKFRVGFNILLPPPELPEEKDLLSMTRIGQIFNKNEVPYGNSLLAAREQKILSSFTGLSWTGLVYDHSVTAFVKLYPEANRVRLYRCGKELAAEGILALRQLLHLKTLYLGQCPSATAKTIGQLFNPTLRLREVTETVGEDGKKKIVVVEKEEVRVFPKLENLNLAGMAVTNDALESISRLPKLRELDLSFCKGITWQGIKHLINCSSLKVVSLYKCPRINPFDIDELAQARPDLNIEYQETFESDPELHALVIEEARHQLQESKQPKYYAFLGPHLIAADKLPSVDNEAEISLYYQQQLAQFGISLKQLEIRTMTKKDWLLADLTIQALKNILRVSDCLVVYWIDKVGYFTDQDVEKPPEIRRAIPLPSAASADFEDSDMPPIISPPPVMRAPQTIPEVRRFLQMPPPNLDLSHYLEKPSADMGHVTTADEATELYLLIASKGRINPSPAYKSQELPFGNLGLTFLPEGLLFKAAWSQVKEVRLEGNPGITRIPSELLDAMPMMTMQTLEESTTRYKFQQEWQKRNDFFLAGLPISNHFLIQFAALKKSPNVHLDLSHCDRISLNGVRALMKDPSLKTVVLRGCPIDLFFIDECRKLHPNIEVQADDQPDKTAVELSIQESRRVMSDLAMKRQYLFLNRALDKPGLIDESCLIVTPADTKRIQDYYTQQLNRFGVNFDQLGLEEPMKREHWMAIDQFLQAYVNLSRVYGAMLQHMPEYEVASSSKNPRTRFVLNFDTVRTYLNKQNHQIEHLDLAHLGITRIPYLFSQQFEWQKVKTINLKGNHIEELPEGCKAFFPSCTRIEYSDTLIDKFDALKTPRGPRNRSGSLSDEKTSDKQGESAAFAQNKGKNFSWDKFKFWRKRD